MITVCKDAQKWDDYVLKNGGHPLQLWGWGEVKSAHNWQAERIMVTQNDEIIGVAQLLIRTLPKPFNALVYVPRGPVAEQGSRGIVLHEIAKHAKRAHKAVLASVEPDWEDMPDVKGWQKSSNTILIPRTLLLDLHKSTDELLQEMAKKTRQYIRKSANEAIEIREVKRSEVVDCLEIYKQTAKRAGFAIHADDYYYDIYDKLGSNSNVFAAFNNDKPVAFLWLAASDATAFELYGGMNDKGQQLRANYALKWHAITAMKRKGVEKYDFNGLLNDGVSTFKQGFASHENMLAGTYDAPLSPLYGVWTKGLPLVKKIARMIR